jgi:ankyrin repeat protein
LYDQSSLLYAVSLADINLIKLLVNHGANLNNCDSNGVYPLHVAINRLNDEICDYLLSNQILLDTPDK